MGDGQTLTEREKDGGGLLRKGARAKADGCSGTRRHQK